MAADLARPAPNLSPDSALAISQQALPLLRESRLLPWPLSLFISNDSQDKWTAFENVYVSCLRTGDEEAARQLRDQLVARFGETNPRVMAYQGMWAESRIQSDKDFVEVLKQYGEILDADPANFYVQKRRIALLRSMNKIPEAVAQLVNLVEVSPTDAEAWAELSDVYQSQGLYEQAIYAMEEVLLIMPNAWNMHAQLGELIYQSTMTSATSALATARGLAEAMRRFCRSIELCDNYIRGYYGLKLTTKKLLEVLPTVGKASGETPHLDLPLPSRSSVERLHELSTSKLGALIRKSSASDANVSGYDKAEVAAARALLDLDASSAPR